jgi:hypothetical protein
MKEIKHLPDLNWSDRARRQIAEAGGDALVQDSHVAYRLGNAAVIGLVYQSFFAPPWLWFALADRVTLRDLIDFRRMQDRIPRGTLTGVEDGDSTAFRFASFYGFVDSGITAEREGQFYIIMRKA